MPIQDIFRKLTLGNSENAQKKAQYELGEVLGAGAFGAVRKGINKANGEEVAVKVISRKEVKKVSGRENAVLHELEILRPLENPHIVRVKDFFESRDKYFIVTQLCTGGELFDRIIDEGKFTEEDAARNIREVAEALRYLHHRNIVHRDVKPENLLYVDKRHDSPLVLADFGIAKSLASPDEKISSAAGSLGYAAPEIFGPDGHGKPCDIWSLGVVLYTLLCGYSPFQAESVEEFLDEVKPGFKVKFHSRYWKNISEDAKELVSKMVQYDPAARPTIDEVYNDKWFGASDNTYDLLPDIKPGLSARMRWRIGFEKIRLARRMKELQLDGDSDDEETGGKPPKSPDMATKFREIVEAAQRNQEILRDSS